jgi:hypothetical protein
MDVLKLKYGRQIKGIIPGWKDYSGDHFGDYWAGNLAGLQDGGCDRGAGV